uniref:SH3 domain-containing protein n=1 Tax=Felis catus TaxID=9685 RepID=A0ABI7VVS1_FELCA
MARLLLLSLPGLVAICAVHGIFMDRLASKKLCADDECVYTISLARAQEDFNAPDCRFINVKKGQQIYVYSKLVKENGAGEFWAGSVRGDSYKYTYILTYGALNFFSGTYLQCIVMFKTSSLEQWRDGRQVHKFTDICFYRMSKKQRQFRNKAKCRRM